MSRIIPVGAPPGRVVAGKSSETGRYVVEAEAVGGYSRGGFSMTRDQLIDLGKSIEELTKESFVERIERLVPEETRNILKMTRANNMVAVGLVLLDMCGTTIGRVNKWGSGGPELRLSISEMGLGEDQASDICNTLCRILQQMRHWKFAVNLLSEEDAKACKLIAS